MNPTSTPFGKLWERIWPAPGTNPEITMGNPRVMRLAAAWLSRPNIRTVEDWGCGFGQFKPYLAPHQTWVGVDGCARSKAVRIVALETYRSQAEGLYMRGVLEHNDRWGEVLENFLASFRRRAVLVAWLPFVHVHCVTFDGQIPVHHFKREEIVPPLEPFLVRERQVPNHKEPYNETLFFLERR